ncbi:MAG: 3-dehydroquinate synthase, partial [Thermoguttaceae bacterium]
ATAEALWDAMLDDGVDRKSVVVAVGGGVVGDLAGFAAATFARGIRFLQVPTTLLAQVDSSVGGKVGVNLEKAKNMVGAFHQPIAVLIDTQTLSTLDEQQYKSGLGEVVKYAESLDLDFFAVLEKNVQLLVDRDQEFLQKVIARCCQIKAEIVLQDEKETTGLRAKLNFGHTFAHAFESLCGFGAFPHGLAVSVGSICAARLAEKLGRLDAAEVNRIVSIHQALCLPTEISEVPFSDEVLSSGVSVAESAVKLMQHDKKNEHGKLRLILPNGLGKCELVQDVPLELIKQVISVNN